MLMRNMGNNGVAVFATLQILWSFPIPMRA